MRSRVVAAAVGVLAVSLSGAGCTDDAEWNRSAAAVGAATGEAVAAAQTGKAGADEELLFVLRSDAGRLSLDANGDGTLSVESDAGVTWFADRPAHDAGQTSTADMLDLFGWVRNGDTLGASAPNAAITADGVDESVVVELNSATRDGDTLTFAVTGVNTSGPLDVTAANATVFIDSVSAAAYPHRSTAELPNMVTATTTVTLMGGMQVATVEFSSQLGLLGTVTLSSSQPTAENVEFDAGQQTLQIDVITFRAAEGMTLGQVVAYGSVSDIRGANFDSFSDEIATWSA